MHTSDPKISVSPAHSRKLLMCKIKRWIKLSRILQKVKATRGTSPRMVAAVLRISQLIGLPGPKTATAMVKIADLT